MSESSIIVIHLSGPDRPGLTHGLLKTISESQSTLWDLGQSVVQGHLSLSAVVEPSANSRFLENALYYASANGLRLEAQPQSKDSIKNGSSKNSYAQTLCITLVGKLSSAHALAACTASLSKQKINIQEIKTLSNQTLHGVEFIVQCPLELEIKKFKESLYQVVKEWDVDVAIQKNDWFRFSRRLVCLDVDSTFVNIEAIDELAALTGKQAEVSAVTEAAMSGKMNFEQALRERVKHLKGLSQKDAAKHLSKAVCNPGIESFVEKLKQLGFKIGLVSGGFDFFVQEIARQHNLDFAFANELEIDTDGNFTGNVLGEILGPDQKGHHLREMCKKFGLQPEHAIAIGDGANDLKMLETAGLGVAYRAKPILKTGAHMALDHASFDDLLYLLGIPKTDTLTRGG